MTRRLAAFLASMTLLVVGGCSEETPIPDRGETQTPDRGELPVPYQEFRAPVDAVGVPVTLAGIEVGDAEACPWVEDQVLLVFTSHAVVDTEGPTLIADGNRFEVGETFVSTPTQPLHAGFECAGRLWTEAVQLTSRLSKG